MLYSTKKKVIYESLKEKQHLVVYEGDSQISCLAVSNDFKHLAIGHGNPNSTTAEIILYDLSTLEFRQVNRLCFHDKGVSHIRFSNDSNYLVSVGSHEEQCIVIWSREEGTVLQTCAS